SDLDWSSDVCSSDLPLAMTSMISTCSVGNKANNRWNQRQAAAELCRVPPSAPFPSCLSERHLRSVALDNPLVIALVQLGVKTARSEERRVGIECRCN